MEREPRAVVDEFLEAARSGDIPRARSLRAERYVEEWPQSGERVVGAERMAAIEDVYPGGRPRVIAVRRTLGHEQSWIVELGQEYPDGSRFNVLEFLGVRDGRIADATAYFGEPFEAPEWRAQWVERIDPFESPAPLPHEHELSRAEVDSILMRYWKASTERDYETLGQLRHPEWTNDWPQSGERVPDHAADRAIHSAYPGYPEHDQVRLLAGESERWALAPTLAPLRVRGGGNVWAGEGALRYPSGENVLSVQLFEFGGRLVRRETTYFMSRFDAPAWREPYVERFDPFADARVSASG